MKKESLALVSLGCAKNAVDLQVRAGNLLKSGCTLSPDPDRALKEKVELWSLMV